MTWIHIVAASTDWMTSDGGGSGAGPTSFNGIIKAVQQALWRMQRWWAREMGGAGGVKGQRRVYRVQMEGAGSCPGLQTDSWMRFGDSLRESGSRQGGSGDMFKLSFYNFFLLCYFYVIKTFFNFYVSFYKWIMSQLRFRVVSLNPLLVKWLEDGDGESRHGSNWYKKKLKGQGVDMVHSFWKIVYFVLSCSVGLQVLLMLYLSCFKKKLGEVTATTL